MVQKTIERGGKVIIPSFAVGRTQELAVFLHQMMSKGEIPNVPVYVDSPLAINASQIFNEHPEVMDAETIADIRAHGHAALDFKEITYTRILRQLIKKHKKTTFSPENSRVSSSLVFTQWVKEKAIGSANFHSLIRC